MRKMGARWVFAWPVFGSMLVLGMATTAGCFPDHPARRGATAGAAGASEGGAGPSGGSGDSGAGQAGGGAGSDGASRALGSACATDETCAGLACRYGFCRTTCATDADCPKGSICLGSPESGVCGLVGDGDRCDGEPCANGALACGIDGRCRSTCEGGLGCPIQGQSCIAGTCVSTLEDGFATTWGACSPEGVACGGEDGNALVYCNVLGPGLVVGASCETAALCAEGLKNGSACASSPCTEGELRCAGDPATTLERCNVGRTAYEPVATCAAPGLCTAGKALGACAPAKCGPEATPPTDKTRCHAGQAETCDGAQYVPTACDGKQCNPATGACLSLDMDATEVTRKQYETFLKAPPPQAGVCAGNVLAADGACMADASVCKDGAGACDNHPQVCVDWCDATAYCAAQGRVLCGQLVATDQMVALGDFAKPGQSAWMNACSSGGELTWTHGNTWDQNDQGQACNGAARAKGPNGQTLEVGQLGTCASPIPAYKAVKDLGGNVAEWENSCAKLASANDASLNDNCRVRGGSFSGELGGKTDLRCDADAVRTRRTTSPYIGFRCCGK